MSTDSLTLDFVMLRVVQPFRVYCDELWDYQFYPEYALLEGGIELRLFDRHERLDPERLRSNWCDENMPASDPCTARLFSFAHGFVIANCFTAELIPSSQATSLEPPQI